MASVKPVTARGVTKYRITCYKGYMEQDGKSKQMKETITYSLEEMGISAVSDKGNPRAESTIMKEVQLYADNLEKRLTGASYMKGDKIRFADFYEKTWKPWAENHFSASTFYTYTRHIEEIFFPEIGSLKIGRITPDRLSAIYLKLAKGGRQDGKEGGYAKQSIVAFHKHLQSVMKLAYKFRIIEENPCLNIEFPKIDEVETVKFLTQEQTEIFLDMLDNPAPCVVKAFYNDLKKEKVTIYDFCARERTRLQYNTFKVLFRVALFSGCRIGELCALTWNDIDFDACTMYINKSVAYAKSKGGAYIKEPKTKKSKRCLPIKEPEITLLKKLRTEQKRTILRMGTAWEGINEVSRLNENFVFPQLSGKVMWKSAPNRILSRLIKNHNAQAPIEKQLPPITVHCLRHTCATLLIAGGADPKTVQTIMGHERIQTTYDYYVDVLPKSTNKAIDILHDMLNVKHA